MKDLKEFSLEAFCRDLASCKPAPGGGAAAALTGALGVSLLGMVAEYALKRDHPVLVKRRLKRVRDQSERLREELLVCVGEDARAYARVAATRQASAREKKAALRQARAVPLKIARLCAQALDGAPLLVVHGSRSLLCDVEVALDLLEAAFRSAMINVRANSV